MKKLNQTGVAHLVAILVVVVIGIVGFTGWKVYDSNQKTKKSLDNASNSGTVTSQKKTDTKSEMKKEDTTTIPTGFIAYKNNLYTLYYPSTWTLSSNDFDSGGTAIASTFELEVHNPAKKTSSNGEAYVMNASIELKADASEGSLIKGLTAEQAATKSQAANQSDKNPNFTHEVGKVTKEKIGKNTAYSFTVKNAFTSDYNNPTNGSGFLMGDAKNLKVYFFDSTQKDVVRIIIDSDVTDAIKSLETLVLR